MKNDIEFSKYRYNLYDKPAKIVAKDFLLQMGFKNVEENLNEENLNFKEIYDVKGFHDIFGEWRIESEIKKDWGTKWKEIPFRYPTMDIPYRKRIKSEIYTTHMMVIGGDLNRLFIVKREIMMNSNISKKKCRNRYSNELEPFYNIDLNSKFSKFYFKLKGKWLPYKNV